MFGRSDEINNRPITTTSVADLITKQSRRLRGVWQVKETTKQLRWRRRRTREARPAGESD
ncbi:hypothetical protein EVAR_69395_1, partial [Eumeta japonica]